MQHIVLDQILDPEDKNYKNNWGNLNIVCIWDNHVVLIVIFSSNNYVVIMETNALCS